LDIEWLTGQVNEPSLPVTTIVIPVYNKVSYTQNCLEQLSTTLPHDFNGEIIVVDDASSDETPAVLEHWAEVDGRIKILRNAENVGFITSCNRGAEAAQGDVLIFLNNDTLPLSGWLPPLLRIFRDKPEAGAVGGKLVYPDGTLQEAGGVIFSDGSGCNFGKHDKAANAPLYNFMREVDYCSGALLATRRALFMELGGFDTRFKPAYYEDTDYCFSLREKGYRVYYQPETVIVHFEGASSGTDIKTGVKSYQAVNRTKFIEKWREVLKHHYPAPDQFDAATLHTLSRRNISGNGHGN
jgi:GT2 family glycosyltransferase